MDFNEIIDSMIERDVYEAHIQVGIPPILRINNELIPMKGSIDEENIINLTEKITNERYSGIGQYIIKYDNDSLTASLYQSYGHPAICLRRCIKTIPTLQTVNAPAIFEKIGNLRSGLVVIGGSTGSGKSTTAYALINEINLNKTRHIFSIDNTIPYKPSHKMSVMKHLCIGADCADQKEGIRIAANTGADIILLNDINDCDAARLILDLSRFTLVIVILHAEDTSDAIQNILWKIGGNETQARYQLSNVLYAITMQKLLPKKNREGRIAAYEIAVNSPVMKSSIRSGLNDFSDILNNDDSMTTFEQTYKRLVEANQIWEEDIPTAP